MFDLNPLDPAGVHVRDVEFAHLLMVWVACRTAGFADGAGPSAGSPESQERCAL